MPLGVFGSIIGSFNVIVAVHNGTSSMLNLSPFLGQRRISISRTHALERAPAYAATTAAGHQ